MSAPRAAAQLLCGRNGRRLRGLCPKKKRFAMRQKPSALPCRAAAQFNCLLEPPLEAHNEANRRPNGWVYQIDGNFGPKDDVPPEPIARAPLFRCGAARARSRAESHDCAA